jgi:hypothetical protein
MVYLVISVIIFNIVVYFTPKHISGKEIYATALFSFLLGISLDTIFDLKLDLYGYFKKGIQLKSFLAIAGLFPASGILFLNFYPERKPFIKKIMYIIFWDAFCLFYEWTAIKAGFFYHNGWTYLASAIVYPILLWFHLTHLSFFRHVKE